MNETRFTDLGPTTWGRLEALGPYHISTLPRYWLSRLTVALFTLTLLVVAWLEEDSLTHRLIDASGDQGWGIVCVLGGVCCLAMLDVLVNDLLPPRYRLGATMRLRHLIYGVISIGIACLIYVVVLGSANQFRPVLLPFALLSALSALVASLDLFQRHWAAK